MKTTWTTALVASAALSLAAAGANPGLARAEEPAERTAPEESAAEAPDNTGVNVRDRDGVTLTPMDQGTSEADVERTRQIRSAITSTDGMSMQARNVKVITREGAVTLRGPVANAEERAAIEAIARQAGATRVDNQLEIDKE
jgi:hyperosmotically inducible periplasmic protein